MLLADILLHQGCSTLLTGPEGQVYKFQTCRGPDRDAEGVEGGREWGGGVPLPSRLVGLGSGEHHKLPQWGPWRSPGRKRVLAYFRAWKNTPNVIETSLSFCTFLGDLVGRIEMPGRPDCGPRTVCWTLLYYMQDGAVDHAAIDYTVTHFVLT